jgi:hypothetical protein
LLWMILRTLDRFIFFALEEQIVVVLDHCLCLV